MKKAFDRYFYGTYARLYAVVALQNIIVFSVNLADSLMLGKYTESAMSGVSLANQYQFLLQMCATGVANGLAVIVSQYWGKKDLKPVRKLFSAALITGFAISAVMTAIAAVFPSGILGLLSSDREIVAEGAEYMKIILFTYIIFMITQILIAVMRSVECVSIGFYTSLLALAVNVSLNYCLIFGKAGLPEMGVRGAAIATLISRVAELLFTAFYVFVIDKRLKLRLKDIFSADKTALGDYLRTGLPMIGSGFLWGVAMSVQTAILGHAGGDGSAAVIGANAVTAPIFQVVSVLFTSSANASGVIIGKTVGEDDVPRVKIYTRRLQLIYVATGLICCVSLLLLKNLLVGFYDITRETADLAKQFLTVLSITIVGSAYEMPALGGIVSAGGDTKFVLKNDIIFMWCMVLPLSYLSAFVFSWAPAVTFFILKSDQITKCIVALVKVNRYKWIKKLTR